MSKRFILNKIGQKHYYNDLVTLIQGLDENEVIDVLYALGLDEFVDPEGGLAPYLSADIVSSEERFLNPAVQHNITLTGKLYNYFREDPDRADSWHWTRDSGDPIEDAKWSRNTKEIVITDTDLTDAVKKGKVYFNLSVKVGEEYFTDSIDFSTIISLNSVQIQSSHSLFLGGTPTEIDLLAKVSEGIYAESFKWYVNDVFKASTRTYKLPSSIIDSGKVANIRLEVLDVKGRVYTDFISIPKISNGANGEPGVPGTGGNSVEFRYQKSSNESTIPTLVNTDVAPAGWILDPPTINGAEVLWMIKSTKKPDGSLVGTWSNPVRISGAQGLAGTTGPIPVQVEWNPGATYLNNSTYKYYIYYRPTNEVYTVIGTSAVANSGAPDTSLFKKETTIPVQIFQTIVAEGGNIGGFIFRNQTMFSQAGLESGTNPTYANLMMNGITGLIKFSKNIEITNTGILFFDKNKKKRIEFGFTLDTDGVPYLRFFDADGNITWEAGKTYTAWVVTGTTQPSWATYGSRRISDESEDYVYDEYSWQFKQKILQFVTNTANSSGPGAMLTPKDPAYFVTGAMPDTVAYALGGGQYRGALYTLNKGDIKENENLFEGFYITKASVQNSQVPAISTLNEGWHIINGMSGVNGGIMEARLNGDESQTYYARVFYVKNGTITRSFDVDVHTQTKQTL